MNTKRSHYLLRRPYGKNDAIGKPYKEIVDKSRPEIKRNVIHFDIDGLIKNHTDPEVWIDHLENDLMKYWIIDSATTFEQDLFPTYRSNKGEVISNDSNLWPPEIKAGLADEDTKGLIDIGQNYIRAHSRQTYAYGIAYNVTGNEEYLRLCKKGAYALVNAIDGNNGMFTKQNNTSGKWGDPIQNRTSQDLAYGLTGMSMYYYLTHDEGMLYKILQAKDYIFEAYFDKGKGIFTWLPKVDEDGDIEIVAQLDQIYAYMMWLTPALPEPYQSEWKASLKKIADILIHRFYSERYGFFWGQDTDSGVHQLGKDHTDFGHSVKTMWLIYEIGILTKETSYVIFAREKINKILEEAYIPETASWGRRFKEDGTLDTDKEWWGLAELDQACAILSLNDPSYLYYLNNTYKYWFDYMVDKKYGEIWHMVSGKDNKPLIQYPKIHSWKNSLHSFEHAIFGYLTSSEIKNRDFTLYYAFKDQNEVSYKQVRPYLFEGNIVDVHQFNEFDFMEDGNKKIKVTFNTLR
jgi:mannose/cellobiose epimerase-like protein (N-acyl-D-glucosamine 2-epimerase family)